MERAELMPRIGTAIDLSAYSTAELRSELANALRLSAQHLMRLASIWMELEKRGEDMSALRTGLGGYLPKIAAGTVLPEIVVMFAGEPMALRKASLLPPATQQRIIDGEELPWAKKKPVANNAYVHGPRPPKPMTRSAGAAGNIGSPPASPAEALAILRAASSKDAVEMIIGMIVRCEDPHEVVERLRAELDRFTSTVPCGEQPIDPPEMEIDLLTDREISEMSDEQLDAMIRARRKTMPARLPDEE